MRIWFTTKTKVAQQHCSSEVELLLEYVLVKLNRNLIVSMPKPIKI